MRKYRRRWKDVQIDTPGMVLTPLTDMALTLLVIFMFAGPVAYRSMSGETTNNDVEVSTNYEPSESETPSIVVGIQKGQSGVEVLLNGKIVAADDVLSDTIKQLMGDNKDQLISIEAGKEVSFDEVIRVIKQLKSIAGIDSISLASKANTD